MDWCFLSNGTFSVFSDVLDFHVSSLVGFGIFGFTVVIIVIFLVCSIVASNQPAAAAVWQLSAPLGMGGNFHYNFNFVVTWPNIDMCSSSTFLANNLFIDPPGMSWKERLLKYIIHIADIGKINVWLQNFFFIYFRNNVHHHNVDSLIKPKSLHKVHFPPQCNLGY